MITQSETLLRKLIIIKAQIFVIKQQCSANLPVRSAAYVNDVCMITCEFLEEKNLCGACEREGGGGEGGDPK